VNPGEYVELDAFASMLAIPIRPDVGYWSAIEEAGDGECDAMSEG